MITYNEGFDDYMNVKTERSLDFYQGNQPIHLGRCGNSPIDDLNLMAGEFLVGYTYFKRDEVST